MIWTTYSHYVIYAMQGKRRKIRNVASQFDIITYILDHEDYERKALVCSMVFIFPPYNKIWGYVTLKEAVKYVRQERNGFHNNGLERRISG